MAETKEITNPKEFRIGNLVQWDDPSHEIIKITEIKKSRTTGYCFSFKGGCAQIGEFVPIVMTEDWIMKCGFKLEDDHGDEKFYQKGKFGVKVSEGEDFYFYKGGSTYSALKEILFVHELQNIYFEHSDEELKIKK